MVYLQLPENFCGKSDEEILKSMHETTFGSDEYNHALTILQLQQMKRTSESTKRLVIATWGLVAATVLLLISTIWTSLVGCAF